MKKKIINLEKVIKVDGRLYYRVRCPCPVCLERGYHTEMRYWKHGDCGGDMYLGGNAHFLCDKCGETNHMMNYGYSCPIHNISSKGEFIGEINSEYYRPGIATRILCEEVGLDFLEEFIIKLKKYINKNSL